MSNEFASYVGKNFTPRKKRGFLAGETLTVKEFLPQYDFGKVRGKWDAYKFQRAGHKALIVRSCERFHQEFEPSVPAVPVVPVAAAPKTPDAKPQTQ